MGKSVLLGRLHLVGSMAISLASACSAEPPPTSIAESPMASASVSLPIASAVPVESAPGSAATEVASAAPAPKAPPAPKDKEVDLDAKKPDGPEPDWKAALVWTVDGSSSSIYSMTTTWLEPGPDGNAREVAHRDEAVVATNAGLRALRGHAGSVKVCVSDACDPKTHKGCKEDERADERLDIVDLSTGKKTPYPGQPDAPASKYQGCAGQLGGYERHPELSVIGPFVSLREWDVDIRQGGLEWGDFASTVNLETNTEDALALPQKDVDRLTKKGFVALVATEADRPCKVDHTETPRRVENKFAYNPRGALIGVYAFRVRNEQACQGPSPYNTTEDVRDAALPAAVGPWKRLPAWLMKSATGDKVLGVSPVPAGQDLVALRRVFATPIPGAKRPAAKSQPATTKPNHH